MGELLDEFDFLIENEIETTFEEDSEQFIKEVKSFKEKSLLYPKATYQGISVKNLCDCIDTGSTAIAPWEHTYFTIDLSILKDINNNRLEELSIPTFIEEIRGVGETEFGFNDRYRNNIKNVRIPKNVIIISPDTFSFYNKLETVKFESESKLIYLGDRAFAVCEKLHTLDLRECKSLDTLPSNLLDNSSVEVLKISSYIKTINENTFTNCKLNTVFIDNEKMTFEFFMNCLKKNNWEPFWSEPIDPYSI